MPILREFEASFPNEAEFTRRFLIPVLQRMGFSVVWYHGPREFGKDLVFAEIDRFGHVCYHGLQAKFVPSISQADSAELIRDAQEAFGNPFVHPATGAEHRISKFYVVNGGSISEQARENFFNRLRPSYGENVRLLSGEEALALDRGIGTQNIDRIRSQIAGLLLELELNRRISDHFEPLLAPIQETGNGPLSGDRLRVSAFADYLVAPFGPLPIDDALQYVINAECVNAELERMTEVLSTVPARQAQAAAAAELMRRMRIQRHALFVAINAFKASLQPIVPA
jgi:hypothetical protein